jgi:hypothetical protein
MKLTFNPFSGNFDNAPSNKDGKSAFTTVKQASANWNSVYSSVKDTSGNWDSVYSTYNKNSADYTKYEYVNNNFLPLSGGTVTGPVIMLSTLEVGDGNLTLNVDENIVSVYGVLSSNSVVYANNGNSNIWNSVYTSVKDTSANWDSVYTSVLNTSSNWDSVYTSVNPVSSNWNSVYTTVSSNSANWNNSYTTVQAKSATEWNNDLATSYTRTYFLPLSGGNITESLSVDKNVYVSGVISASASNVKINIINDSISRTFTDDDNNKVVHLNTTSCPLCAIFPNNLSSGFNVAIMNIGTNNLILSAADLKSAGTVITTQYGGAFVYKELNDIFAVGRLV